MTRKRYPSEISTRTVRLNIGDWQVLNEISRSHNITFAEAFHQLMIGLSKEPAAVTSKAQIPMSVFRIPSKLAVKVSPVTSMATNGSKGVAFRITPRGARYD
ncbi:hypothetical protein ES705_46415 [subsurface metagenome]